MCVCACVCGCIRERVWMCLFHCVHMYIVEWIYVHTHTHTHTHARAHIYICIYIYINSYRFILCLSTMDVSTHTNTHIHTHTHTYIYIYIYIYMNLYRYVCKWVLLIFYLEPKSVSLDSLKMALWHLHHFRSTAPIPVIPSPKRELCNLQLFRGGKSWKWSACRVPFGRNGLLTFNIYLLTTRMSCGWGRFTSPIH